MTSIGPNLNKERDVIMGARIQHRTAQVASVLLRVAA
jgi:hypothetical protein